MILELPSVGHYHQVTRGAVGAAVHIMCVAQQLFGVAVVCPPDTKCLVIGCSANVF